MQLSCSMVAQALFCPAIWLLPKTISGRCAYHNDAKSCYSSKMKKKNSFCRIILEFGSDTTAACFQEHKCLTDALITKPFVDISALDEFMMVIDKNYIFILPHVDVYCQDLRSRGGGAINLRGHDFSVNSDKYLFAMQSTLDNSIHEVVCVNKLMITKNLLCWCQCRLLLHKELLAGNWSSEFRKQLQWKVTEVLLQENCCRNRKQMPTISFSVSQINEFMAHLKCLPSAYYWHAIHDLCLVAVWPKYWS